MKSMDIKIMMAGRRVAAEREAAKGPKVKMTFDPFMLEPGLRSMALTQQDVAVQAEKNTRGAMASGYTFVEGALGSRDVHDCRYDVGRYEAAIAPLPKPMKFSEVQEKRGKAARSAVGSQMASSEDSRRTGALHRGKLNGIYLRHTTMPLENYRAYAEGYASVRPGYLRNHGAAQVEFFLEQYSALPEKEKRIPAAVAAKF